MNPKWEIKFGGVCGGLPCPSPNHCVTPREYEVPGLEMCLPPGLDLDNLPAHTSFETTKLFLALIWICVCNVCLGLFLYACLSYMCRLRRRGRRPVATGVPLVDIRPPPPAYRTGMQPVNGPPPLVVHSVSATARPPPNIPSRIIP